MPRISGKSDEWMEMLEDEIASMITAREDLQDFHGLILLLYQKDAIARTVLQVYMRKLDGIEEALKIGKRNTAALRNGRVQ
jgi:hypothetical protein